MALFGRYAGRIKAYAMRGGASASDADEIAQDVMVAVWRHAASFDPARAARRRPGSSRSRATAASTPSAAPAAAAPGPAGPAVPARSRARRLPRLNAAEREARLRDGAGRRCAPEQRRVLVGRLLRGPQPRRDRRARAACRSARSSRGSGSPSATCMRYWARIWRRGSTMTDAGADGRGLARQRRGIAPSRPRGGLRRHRRHRRAPGATPTR